MDSCRGRLRGSLDALSKGGRAETGGLLEGSAQVRVVGEAAGVSYLDNGAFRIAQQLESLPDADRGQMVAERAPHEPTKAAGHVHRVDADGQRELG